MKVITVLLFSLLLLPLPVAAQGIDDHLIVPGQRIGKWTLAVTIGNLVQMSGKDYTIVDEKEGNPDLRLSLETYCWGRFHASFRDPKRVEYLYWNKSSLFKTKEGVGAFSSRAEVEAAYGKPTAITNKAANYSTRLIYDEIGIAFQLDPKGDVHTVLVFPAGTANTIWKF